MAFHVACPVTSKRICFCKLGFPQKIQSVKAKECFLEQVFRVEEVFNDSCSIRSAKSETAQVVVPKVVPAPPPPPSPAKRLVDGDGEKTPCFQSKQIGIQKRAVACTIEAEDHGRNFEAGRFTLEENVGEAAWDVVEDKGVKVMCRICFHSDNEGSHRAKRMLACKLCNKKYHTSCLRSWGHNRDLFHVSSWVCPSCRTCEGCRKTGDVTKFVFCKRCDAAYHSSCQPHLSKNGCNGPYLCPKHTKCHSCESKLPGNGPSTRWFLGYTCCDACGRLFVKGNYCSVCLKVYRDSELTPMVCCDVCDHWVHCQCDGISEERYLQFQADGNLRYTCAACRGDCHQVTGLDDAVKELWRRRDIADHDQISSLRASLGLPLGEVCSVSIYSDDEDYSSTTQKKEYGPSVKFSFKGSVHQEITKTKEYGKQLPNENSGKKNDYKVLLNGEIGDYQTYEGFHDRRSVEFSLSDVMYDEVQLYRSEGKDILPPIARSLGKGRENCSINQAGITKQNFVEKAVATSEDRIPKAAQIKSSESRVPVVGIGNGTQASKSENVKGTKLVIHVGGKHRNVNNSLQSEASVCHREPDVKAAKGEKKRREGSSIKVEKLKSEVPDLNTEYGNGHTTTAVKDPKPLLKLKFKRPYVEKHNSLQVVPQEEDKRERTKRKTPEETNQVSQEEEDSRLAMDANWILNKLGKDAIGKRVEIHHPAQDSWHKGEVIDMIGGKSSVVVHLDDGGARTFQLGSQAIRLIPQKRPKYTTTHS